jgi:uncharacterized protein YecE (DUF72 family)
MMEKQKDRQMPSLFIGTSGYGYKEWKGKFYPEKFAPNEMLGFYARHFNAVEINNTFYHRPSPKILSAWAAQVPENFVFTIKAPQVITHLKRLKNVNDEVGYLFSTLSVLERKLGPVLFQLPKSFRADYSLLEDFLKLIPVAIDCAFEFRNPSWLTEEVLDLLRLKGSCLCLTDLDEKPVDEIRSTSSWGYLRLRRSEYSNADLAQWAERIFSQKWTRAFVFFKHEEEAIGPETAIRFQKLMPFRQKKAKKSAQAV